MAVVFYEPIVFFRVMMGDYVQMDVAVDDERAVVGHCGLGILW